MSTDLDRLRELVGILGDMPGDGADLIRPHIDPELLKGYAEKCSRVILYAYLSQTSDILTEAEMVEMLGSTYLSAFALGCAWSKMKQGSGEK